MYPVSERVHSPDNLKTIKSSNKMLTNLSKPTHEFKKILTQFQFNKKKLPTNLNKSNRFGYSKWEILGQESNSSKDLRFRKLSQIPKQDVKGFWNIGSQNIEKMKIFSWDSKPQNTVKYQPPIKKNLNKVEIIPTDQLETSKRLKR